MSFEDWLKGGGRRGLDGNQSVNVTGDGDADGDGESKRRRMGIIMSSSWVGPVLYWTLRMGLVMGLIVYTFFVAIEIAGPEPILFNYYGADAAS